MLDGKTTLCGLFGYPVEHSFSPAMHNAAFKALGLNWAYLPFKVEPRYLSQAVDGVRALNLAGVNVTVPHKEAVIPYLDELSPGAKAAGAVNVIVNNEGKLTGHNTDGAGFTRSIKEETGFTPQHRRVVILGAGGAAKAVVVQLAMEGAAKITLVNRTPSRAEQLAQTVTEMGCAAGVATWDSPDLRAVVAGADLVVQATNMGMYPDIEQCPPVPPGSFRPGQVVCDLVYNPVETKFLQMAVGAGAVGVNGLGMLLYQGVLAFELWTGKTAPVDVMKKSLYSRMGG